MTCQVGSAARSTVLSSSGGTSVKDNIVNVFGARLAQGLAPLTAETPSGTKLTGYAPLHLLQATGGNDKGEPGGLQVGSCLTMIMGRDKEVVPSVRF